MPTGYTSIIEDNPNVTMRDYALRCVRAMGACIMQRDDPLDDPPNTGEPNSYYREAKAKVEAELAQLESMDKRQKQKLFEKHIAEITEANVRYASEHKRKSDAYARIRADVVAWKPPTPDHEGLKKFMLEQIDLCYQPAEKLYLLLPAPSAEIHYDVIIAELKREIANHLANEIEEAERHRERTNWIAILVESLPIE